MLIVERIQKILIPFENSKNPKFKKRGGFKLASLTKCDICASTSARDETYMLKVYKRGDRTTTTNDMCHKCFKGILDNGLKPKWQRWNTSTKKYEDVE